MIEFLTRNTAKGATYLQVIILSVLLIAILGLLIKQIIYFVKCAKKKIHETETEINTDKLFQQINSYIPINGYQIFSELQNGNRYTVTFLSKDSNDCVLAEVEDISDPQGAIKIITF